MFDQMKKEGLYGVDIVGDVAYINVITDNSPYFASNRDTDFIGTKEECLKYLDKKDIKNIYGLNDEQ